MENMEDWNEWFETVSASPFSVRAAHTSRFGERRFVGVCCHRPRTSDQDGIATIQLQYPDTTAVVF